MTQKKNLLPQHKRLKRQTRFQAAKTWITKYNGKNIIKGYSKHFAVDKMCAVKELEMISVQIDSAYIKQLKRSIENTAKAKEAKQRKRQEEEETDEYIDSDENSAYIAGYTLGGFPYGLTEEEQKEIEK